MAVYGEKFEDLEEFELREVHELDALLSSARLGPRAYGRLAASRARASGGTRGP